MAPQRARARVRLRLAVTCVRTDGRSCGSMRTGSAARGIARPPGATDENNSRRLRARYVELAVVVCEIVVAQSSDAALLFLVTWWWLR